LGNIIIEVCLSREGKKILYLNKTFAEWCLPATFTSVRNNAYMAQRDLTEQDNLFHVTDMK